jgi:Multicopper oxidase
MGDLSDDDRGHGMGIVIEYAGRSGQAQWIAPPPFHWSYLRFAKPGATAPEPDETFEMTFAKDNAADDGFNRRTINGVAYPMTGEIASRTLHLREGMMLGGYQKAAVDFIADDPGLTLFHCHQQLHMDFGFMALFDYV